MKETLFGLALGVVGLAVAYAAGAFTWYFATLIPVGVAGLLSECKQVRAARHDRDTDPIDD